MAQTNLTLTVRLRWWVRPYIWLLQAFIWTAALVLDEDDDRLDEFLSKQGCFIGRHGLKFFSESGEAV
ncbi:hypothetical protein GRZ55_11590 [Chelativorans sp. ZYF759]|uniref:hypothetical protein n=1 Tax=Chelativorans sp. ZYF759 TaxID=2692213 RepID=UPI00145E9E64|nr:hypothetical protein [Chelativorans sp. ZYF759]NMG39886.1 hypothetical protein [Chelativorans sp. ZYF759]